MKCLFVFILIILFGLSDSIAQQQEKKIDSLLNLAEKSNDSVKLRIHNKVAFYYIFNKPDKAKQLLKKGIAYAQRKKVSFSEAEMTNTYGIYKDVSGQSDSAVFYFQRALKISKAKDYKIITVMIINNLGMYHWNKGEYDMALKYFFEALEMNKSNSTDKGDAVYLNNIGLIYQEMKQYEKSLDYFNKSLKIREKHRDLEGIAHSMNNIGISNRMLGNELEAEKAYKRGLAVAQDINEYGTYNNILSNLSTIYIDQEKYEEAIPLLKKVILSRDTSNIDRRANLSSITKLIEIYNRKENIAQVEKYILKGNAYVYEFPDLKNSLIDFYTVAAESHYRLGNIEKGKEYFSKTLAIKDSLFSGENAKEVAVLETKFRVAEKEKALFETKANLAEKELEVEQKNSLIYGGLVLIISLIIVSFLFFKQQKLKSEQVKKEAQLQTALARIETQNKLEEQRLRISRDLHDNIGSQLTFIISSIHSISFRNNLINTVTLKKLQALSKFTQQSIFELRDTIWIMNNNEVTLEELEVRIRKLLENAKDFNPTIDYDFTLAKNSYQKIVFNSGQIIHIYRIIQEAINNAIKHSGAQTIKLVLVAENQILKIRIKDNGIGFNLDKKTKTNGLNNIKERANRINASLKMHSSANGTEVTLTMPL